MKFLCVGCDEAMKLEQTLRPDGGSLTAIFRCPACGRETALLTNAMETQMVRSLGVKIGGRTAPSEPMELVRHSLAPARQAPHPTPSSTSPQEDSASKCPFAGVVADAFGQSAEGIAWTEGAEERMARVPSVVQPMVRKGVEMHAREHGYTEISEAIIDEVKARFGM